MPQLLEKRCNHVRNTSGAALSHGSGVVSERQLSHVIEVFKFGKGVRTTGQILQQIFETFDPLVLDIQPEGQVFDPFGTISDYTFDGMIRGVQATHIFKCLVLSLNFPQNGLKVQSIQAVAFELLICLFSASRNVNLDFAPPSSLRSA